MSARCVGIAEDGAPIDDAQPRLSDEAFAELLRANPPQPRPPSGVRTWWRWGDLFVEYPWGGQWRWRHANDCATMRGERSALPRP